MALIHAKSLSPLTSADRLSRHLNAPKRFDLGAWELGDAKHALTDWQQKQRSEGALAVWVRLTCAPSSSSTWGT